MPDPADTPAVSTPGPSLPDPQNVSATPSSAQTLASLQAQVEAQTARALELQDRADRVERELALAIQRYRQALLATAPELPEELLSGETVADLETSLARARSLVERVRSRIEDSRSNGAETGGATTRVPAGAPPRRSPDLSALSARDKIALGLERR